ncbi:uncharacterized protein LOC119281839 [Triticum dicoccoides]|uniref:uncharacterized protein LOC119281839 n=1 Tax=Triticum dicoccoides TaxID=85692 RepID=UPI0018902227|nr:uncharacterized protein LOC119281839 [Triticum dicoccoides]
MEVLDSIVEVKEGLLEGDSTTVTGGWMEWRRYTTTDRFGSFGRGGGRFGAGNEGGRGDEDEDEFAAEGREENLIWQAKTGKKEAVEDMMGRANGEGDSSGMEKGKEKDTMIQKEQSAQQQLLTSLLSQLVQGLRGGEKEMIEGAIGKSVEVQSGRDGMRREEKTRDPMQKADKKSDQDPVMEMKKQGGRGNWQLNLDEGKKGMERLNKQVCGKCKDPRHSTRDCRVGHYLICGRENHITSECNLLKQMKPVPKYVGYAAKGLGILLVQSYKDVLVAEHTNPLGVVIIREGNINETELTKAMEEMFYWGWQWRVKEFGENGFMMRFPNKAKLVEMAKFNDFNLLGTGVVIKVQPWSLDHQAVGKMHTAWVKLSKVPDCFRHFLGICEVSAAVGPVLEVDMDTVNEEKVRVKCGIRDVEITPPQVEIAAPDLLMFRIGVEVEKVVKIGWYKEDKRKNENTHNLEDGDGETKDRKRFRVEDTEHKGITLGCLSLKQSEEVDGKLVKMKAQLEESMMQWQDEMYAERRKWQKESDIMFNNIKTLEEDKARHNALCAKAE